MKYRIEKDTIGKVKVPSDVYWGAQTERSRQNFKIGASSSMPLEIIYGFAYLKKSAAYTNHELGILSIEKRDLISKVCDEIISGIHDNQFPLVIWQTGSGTQTNMNINEVISNRAQVISGEKIGKGEKVLEVNDDVNKSQSSNDTFPTAMHIATFKMIVEVTIPGVENLLKVIESKSHEFKSIIKIGRTHLMDATPLTVGQEFSGYCSQLKHTLKALNNTLLHLSELALGGTAVGTGINAPKGYSQRVAEHISNFTGYKFITAENKFEALAAHDAIVETHGALKQLAVALNKIANDIRLLSSGPRSGIGELIIPSNEPGSSIMPGKVNPTQCEALTMVCAQVMGNDVAISIGGAQGHFELNVFKPLMASNIIQSAKLLGDACQSFSDNCIKGIKVNKSRIKELVDNSLMLVTTLNTKIGYYKAAEIANKAYKEKTSLKEAAISLGYLSEAEFNKWVRPELMIGDDK
ncbi:MAG: fumarate hydratase, class II [Flavobacteriaceae bacterium]|nr:fumarate hydratase, class II [Flavobacteriaceae bacterium]|tara:strand:- start:419 stop:1816 length:1398 start_codon:yes stop_codon:yes gene_type:complete